MPGLAPFKQIALARDLQMRLSLTIAGVAIVASSDASSNPILQVSRNSEVEFITITPSDPGDGRIDALGISQTRYSPHVLKLVACGPTGALDNEMRAKVMAECTKSFCELVYYETPIIGPAVVAVMPTSVADVTAVKIAAIEADAINPLTSQQ